MKQIRDLNMIPLADNGGARFEHPECPHHRQCYTVDDKGRVIGCCRDFKMSDLGLEFDCAADC